VICDGNNGTPDLRDKFVVGAGNTYAVDETGGLASHTHHLRGDGHTHNLDVIGVGMSSFLGSHNVTSSSQAEGHTDSGSTLSPYYALAYIMYL